MFRLEVILLFYVHFYWFTCVSEMLSEAVTARGFLAPVAQMILAPFFLRLPLPSVPLEVLALKKAPLNPGRRSGEAL